jgi:hypothetical protein
MIYCNQECSKENGLPGWGGRPSHIDLCKPFFRPHLLQAKTKTVTASRELPSYVVLRACDATGYRNVDLGDAEVGPALGGLVEVGLDANEVRGTALRLIGDINQSLQVNST